MRAERAGLIHYMSASSTIVVACARWGHFHSQPDVLGKLPYEMGEIEFAFPRRKPTASSFGVTRHCGDQWRIAELCVEDRLGHAGKSRDIAA